MSTLGLNTYLYAPKDDLHHRALWRESYPPADAAKLQVVVAQCQAQRLRFIYALGPGLDFRYGDDSDLEHIQRRFDQLMGLGCRDFALLFDDIPDHLAESDRAKWGSFAGAQGHVANAVFQWLRARVPGARFLFCPTPYCGRMAERQLGGVNYLEHLGRELAPEIDVFWTGPEIVSPTISLDDIANIRAQLGRAPLIWDNLHANDYDGRRFYCGPVEGRSPGLKSAVRGWLVNPNCEFPLNFVPLRTFAEFLRATAEWNPRAAYQRALREWQPRFATAKQTMGDADLTLLADCFYLPHQDGPEAEALYQSARLLIDLPPAKWGTDYDRFMERAQRLRECCARLPEMRDRSLFYALNRRVWELREELDLLIGWLKARRERPEETGGFASDSHLPGTYRGGFVPRLQQLLRQQAGGMFVAASSGGLSS